MHVKFLLFFFLLGSIQCEVIKFIVSVSDIFSMFWLIRTVIFVKMSDFVGRVCALNVMLDFAGHTFMSHGG